jgi:hypothetical protein
MYMKIEIDQITKKLDSIYEDENMAGIKKIRGELHAADQKMYDEDDCHYADILICKLIVQLFISEKEKIDKDFKKKCAHEIYDEISNYLSNFNYLTTQHIKDVFTDFTSLKFE